MSCTMWRWSMIIKRLITRHRISISRLMGIVRNWRTSSWSSIIVSRIKRFMEEDLIGGKGKVVRKDAAVMFTAILEYMMADVIAVWNGWSNKKARETAEMPLGVQNAWKTTREARESNGMPMTRVTERVEDNTCMQNVVDAIVIGQICDTVCISVCLAHRL